MKRYLCFFIMVGLLLVLAAPVEAQEAATPEPVGLRPDAPTYALHGPYGVGTREFVVEPDSDRPLPLTVWYPTARDTSEGEYSYMPETPPLPIMGHAFPDAAPSLDDGPYPLVLFSHGAGGMRYAALYLTEHLASYGFVVMAPDHTGDTAVNAEEEAVFLRSHVTRPVDITRVIDFAQNATQSGGALENLIDMDHVAVAGHSSGAWTAMLAGGAQRDYRALQAWCAENPDDFWTCANLLGQEERLAELMGLETVPQGLWPAVGDSRVDAIIPLAPGNATAFGPEGLASITVPALVMIGDQDMFLPYDSFGPPTYDAISGEPKALVTFQSGNHMLFANACSAAPWFIDAGLYWACSDPVWDMDRAHDLINHLTTAFLLDTLKGDKDAAAALAPDAVSFPGIEYQAQGF